MAKPIENNKKRYMEYVQKKLKKYKVNDPAKVPNKHKKKFFNELDKGWESKEEKKQKKEKKKSEVIQAVKAKLLKKSDLSSHAKDWETTLKRVVTYLVINLKNNNGDAAKKQVDILKQSCEDIDALLEDSNKKSSLKSAGFWTQKIMTHKNMSKIKNLIIDMKEDLMGDDSSEGDEDKFISDFVRTIDPLLAGVKIAPKQPPKGWWDKMHTDIKKKNPEYDKETLDKVIGDIWYNKMKGPKKKEVMEEYEG